MNQDNIASYKTAESMGMSFLHLYTTKQGETCKVYRITRKEWKAISDTLIFSDELSIVKLNKSMYYDVWQNSLDDNNRQFVPDEVFETLDIATEVVDQLIECYQSEEGPFVYAVIRNEDKKNLGYVQLIPIDEGYEIGYHIAKQYCGHGYATKAVELFLEYLKHNSTLKEIIGVALMDNVASRKVLLKNGFIVTFEGEDQYQGNKRNIIKTIRKL